MLLLRVVVLRPACCEGDPSPLNVFRAAIRMLELVGGCPQGDPSFVVPPKWRNLLSESRPTRAGSRAAGMPRKLSVESEQAKDNERRRAACPRSSCVRLLYADSGHRRL